MGTKNNPGEYDCYDKAEPDEPMFVLLARDEYAPQLVELWAAMRTMHGGDKDQINEAIKCAVAMDSWRKENR